MGVDLHFLNSMQHLKNNCFRSADEECMYRVFNRL